MGWQPEGPRTSVKPSSSTEPSSGWVYFTGKPSPFIYLFSCLLNHSVKMNEISQTTPGVVILRASPGEVPALAARCCPRCSPTFILRGWSSLAGGWGTPGLWQGQCWGRCNHQLQVCRLGELCWSSLDRNGERKACRKTWRQSSPWHSCNQRDC